MSHMNCRGDQRCKGAQRRQSGQAQVLSMLVVAVLVLVMFGVYNVGQLTLAKTRLQNTADAAAFSAAQTQARDYNFAAYMNRAMVANQVSAAQMVGLTSWMRSWKDTYHGPFSQLPDRLIAIGPSPLQGLWTVPEGIHRTASNITVDSATRPMTGFLAVLIKALALAQDVYHYASVVSIAQVVGFDETLMNQTLGVDFSSLDASSNMVSRNYPGAQLSLFGQLSMLKGLVDWFDFTEFKVPVPQSGSNRPADDRFAEVTVASLDNFSSSRGSNTSPFDMPPLPFLFEPSKFIPYNNGPFLMMSRRLGGTELKGDKRTWAAVDSGGIFSLMVFWISVLGIPIPIVFPIFAPQGHGAAQAGVQASSTQAPSPFNNFQSNDSLASFGGQYRDTFTAPAAWSGLSQGAGNSLATNLAFTEYLDVAEPNQDLPAPSWLLEIQAPINKVPNTNDRTSAKYKMDAQGKNLRAMAKAQVYFARPSARTDGKVEWASLYNPYWQARLQETSFMEKYLSLASTSLSP